MVSTWATGGPQQVRRHHLLRQLRTHEVADREPPPAGQTEGASHVIQMQGEDEDIQMQGEDEDIQMLEDPQMRRCKAKMKTEHQTVCSS